MVSESRQESQVTNQLLFEKLGSSDSVMVKEAVDAVNDFTRTRMREDGFFRRIMPPLPITNEELDRQLGTDKSVKIVDKEPDSPAAVSVPLATLPKNLYIRGNRYPVMFDRIMTDRFQKDTDELRTYIMDIRQVISDNAIKDMLAEEDGKFISAVDSALVGPGVAPATSGTVQYEQISGGVTRENLADMLKIVPNTPFSLEAHTALTNHITIKEVIKFGRNEQGGDLAETVARDGWSLEKYFGLEWIVTIKKTLVPTNHVYLFADPKFIGKHYQLEDTTMYVKREAFMLEFFAYQYSGATLGHTGGLGHCQFV